ncbi:hypothetical protein V8C35DRAFT_293316 [Trichoderma chlorosporum]
MSREPMRLCLIGLFWPLHSGNHWLPRSPANQKLYRHFSINTPQLAEATNTIRMEATLLAGVRIHTLSILRLETMDIPGPPFGRVFLRFYDSLAMARRLGTLRGGP